MTRKTAQVSVADSAPYIPAKYDVAVASAIQALMNGSASEHQQKMALKWIIEVAAGTYDLSFRPGAQEGERDTTFAEGRRFVGLTLVKLTHLNVSKLRSDEHVVSEEV